MSTKTHSMVSAILGNSPTKHYAEGGIVTEDPHAAGLDAAADELLRAIHSHDKPALIEALKSFMSICDDMEEAAESPETEASEGETTPY